MDVDTDLNPQQREAVMHAAGPLLVLAGAGSGKTRVITCRIARLLRDGVPPRAILAVTFTNKAAGEMRSRTEQLLGRSAGGLWIGTFHSICARLLRMYGEALGYSRSFVIYDTDDQLALLKRLLADLGISDRMLAPKELRWRIDRAKNRGMGPDEYEGGDPISDLVAEVYPEYEKRLLEADAVDFGNLLIKANQLLARDDELRQHLAKRFEHVLVDEFQDTNSVQYELVRQLSCVHRNLCVVGDDDQSIYGWRGADIRNILGFEKDHPNAKVVKLEQNYRSTQVVLDAAAAVITPNRGRKPKHLWTEQQGGELIGFTLCDDERDEAATVVRTVERLRQTDARSYGDVAIFYRTHAQSRVLEEALRSAFPPIPYTVVGGVRFYDRAEIKDVLAYLRALANPGDEVSLRRIINVPTRGIGARTLENISALARQESVSLWEALELCCADIGPGADVLKSGPRRKLSQFRELMTELRAESAALPIAELAERVLERTGYVERLAIDGSPESQSRAENIMELIGGLREYEANADEPSLTGYLEHVALATDVDAYTATEGHVTLMTVHSAKGLEFPVVFVVGLEQGVFPHARALHDTDQMEEERRLAYVALTRARERLFLSCARDRWVYSYAQENPPSEFLEAIPAELIKSRVPPTWLPSPGRPRDRRSTGGKLRHSKQRRHQTDDVWIDRSYDQSAPDEEEASGYRVGMHVRHPKFGVGEVRVITGASPNQNLTIFFATAGTRTIRSRFVQPA